MVGHDFEGVSLEKVRDAYPNGQKDAQGRPDPVQGMKVLLNALQIRVDDNPYLRLAGFVAGQLRAT